MTNKSREKSRRHRRAAKIAKYGEEFADVDMRGRHGNHARGEKNARWSSRLITSHGYVAVRVPPDHPHAWGSPRLKRFKYAYEHVVVAMNILGRPLREDEVVHHRNGDRTDNSEDNLEILTTSEHACHHASVAGRDDAGRFNSAPRSGDPSEWPESLRVREVP